MKIWSSIKICIITAMLCQRLHHFFLELRLSFIRSRGTIIRFHYTRLSLPSLPSLVFAVLDIVTSAGCTRFTRFTRHHPHEPYVPGADATERGFLGADATSRP